MLEAILIDPSTQSITRTTIPDGLEGLYETLRCETVDAIDLGSGITLWIDDEGLLKDNQSFFELINFGQPIAGTAVILSTDKDGESISVDARLTVDHVKKVVSFVELESYPEPKIEFRSF